MNNQIFYSYAPGNRRVWRGTGTWTTQSSVGSGSCNTAQWSTDEVTFWGIDGKKLMTYNLAESPINGPGGEEVCSFTARFSANALKGAAPSLRRRPKS